MHKAFSGWLSSTQSGDAGWQPLRATLLVLLVCLVIGPLVALGLNWSAFSFASPNASAQRLAEATPAPFASVTVTSTALVVAMAPTLAAARATPMPTPTAAAQAAPQTATPEPPATFTPTPAPVLTADEAWAEILPRLDDAWGVDTQSAIGILHGFLSQFPDYPPAVDKLYAALVASAGELAAGGALQEAQDTLARAIDLDPDRSEARDALLALTPTPDPGEPPVAGVQARPASLVAAARPQTATQVTAATRPPVPRPTLRVEPQAPLPTSTKVPFQP